MNNHNFFIFSNCDFSRNSAATTRMIYYAKALAGTNHKVYLLTCSTSKLSDEDFLEIVPNVFVLDKKELTHNFFETFKFLRRMDAFAKKKIGESTFILYPLVFIFLEIFSVLYLKLYKKRSVFCELNEVRKHASAVHKSVSIKRLSYSFKKIMFKSIFTLTESLLFLFDGLICISTEIEKYGQKFNKNTIRVPILTDPEILISKSETVYASDGFFNIGFSGSIIPSKENLLEFMAVLNRLIENGKRVKFNICGIVKEEDLKLLKKVEEKKGTITYYGNLSQEELSTFLMQQDLLVIPRGYNLQNKYGFSTKLSDYLNHKKIILVTDISDNKLYIKDGVNGFIVPPNDPQAMYERIEYVMNNFKALEKEIIPNAQKVSFNEFNYKNFRAPLRTFLKKSSKSKIPDSKSQIIA